VADAGGIVAAAWLAVSVALSLKIELFSGQRSPLVRPNEVSRAASAVALLCKPGGVVPGAW
jgi:hypothetical protein